MSNRNEQSALNTQIGGDHYKKLKIQPMEYSMANNLDACQHTAIKYITRFRDKGGIADLEKAKHVIDMLIEFEQKAAAPAAGLTPNTRILEKAIEDIVLLLDDRLMEKPDALDLIAHITKKAVRDYTAAHHVRQVP